MSSRYLIMTAAIAATVVATACSDTTSPSTTARTAAPGSARPAIATGGNTIVFERFTAGNEFIFTMNDDGTNLTKFVVGSRPAWSPDHSKIVFSANNTIFIMNADGTGIRQLGISNDRFASFNADGSKVVFAHATSKGDSDIFTVNVDGTNRQLLLRMGGVALEDPRISPDGTKLAVQATRRNDSDILVVDLATGRRTVVAGGEFRETVPAWSPDSKRLAYLTGLRNKGLCIEVVNADGTGRKAFTNDVGFCSTVSWSPDGKELAFDSSTEEPGLYRAPVDVPGTPVRLTTPSTPDLDVRLSWTR